jgi:hypothetical protein
MDSKVKELVQNELNYLLMTGTMFTAHFCFVILKKCLGKNRKENQLLIKALQLISDAALWGTVIMILLFLVCHVWSFVETLIKETFGK